MTVTMTRPKLSALVRETPEMELRHSVMIAGDLLLHLTILQGAKPSEERLTASCSDNHLTPQRRAALINRRPTRTDHDRGVRASGRPPSGRREGRQAPPVPGGAASERMRVALGVCVSWPNSWRGWLSWSGGLWHRLRDVGLRVYGHVACRTGGRCSGGGLISGGGGRLRRSANWAQRWATAARPATGAARAARGARSALSTVDSGNPPKRSTTWTGR